MGSNIRWLGLAVLSASIGLGGCASNTYYHRDVVTRGTVPAERLAAAPRIVVEEHAVRLSGPTREEKERFEEEREKRIDSGTRSVGNPAGAAAGAVIKEPRLAVCILPPLLPACMVAFAGVYGTAHGIERARASRQVPAAIWLSEKERARLARLVEERITAASLGERVASLAESTAAPDPKAEEFPRLLIRVTSATLSYEHDGLGLIIEAEAQALPSPSNAWTPTYHLYTLPYQKLDQLTKKTDEPLRRQMDLVLDYLSYAIWDAYSPKGAAK